MGQITRELTGLLLLVVSSVTLIWGIAVIAKEIDHARRAGDSWSRSLVPRYSLGWMFGGFLIGSDALVYGIIGVSTLVNDDDGSWVGLCIMLQSAALAVGGFFIWATRHRQGS